MYDLACKFSVRLCLHLKLINYVIVEHIELYVIFLYMFKNRNNGNKSVNFI